MSRRTRYLLFGLSAVALVVVAGLLVWQYALAPPLAVRDLRPGERVELRSGLSFRVPTDASGSLSTWRSSDAELPDSVGLADTALVAQSSANGDTSIGLDSHWTTADGRGTVALVESGRLAAASADGTVRIYWLPPLPDRLNLHIVTHLPGHLPGVVSLRAPGATDAGKALEAAAQAWRLLQISGADLPGPAT